MAWRRRTVLGMGAGLAGLASARRVAARATPGFALTMATGEPGGGFAAFGAAWGSRIGQRADASVSYRVSGGSAANILLVEQGAAQIGLTTMAVADQAWLGTAGWTGRIPLRGFRVLFPVFEATWQVVAPLGSAVRRLADLASQRIGVGPAGGGSAVLSAALLDATGISPRLAVTGLYAQQIALLRRHEIAACAFLGPTPLPIIRADAMQGGFNLIGVDAAQGRAMLKAVPGLGRAVIPRVSLPRQTAAVSSVGTTAIAIARADLPDALAGRLVEAAFATGIVPLRRHWIGQDDPVGVHPGAAPVLRRLGFSVPARLLRG